MLSDDERDDLLADRNFILGREYEKARIKELIAQMIVDIEGENK
jgi:hypothetical protein